MLNIRRINNQTAHTTTIDSKHFQNDIVGKVSCGAAAWLHSRIPQQPVENVKNSFQLRQQLELT